MKTIIIDTNALMAISELKLDLFSELDKACLFPYTLVVLSGTIDELKRIKENQRHKFRKAASLALQLLEAKKIDVISSPGTKLVDDSLVEHSQKGDLILTQDKELKKRLARPYLTIRQKKRVIIVG